MNQIVDVPRQLHMKSFEHKDVVPLLNRQDPVAFKAVWDEYYAHAFLKARRYVVDEEVAKDIVQEAFMKLWLHRNFNNESHVVGFLMRTVSNNCLSYLEALPREEKFRANLAILSETVDDPSAETITRADLYNEIEQHLSLLPEKYRKYYELARQGLSHQEIGKKLEISPKTAKNYPGILRAMLRKAMLKYPNTTLLITIASTFLR